MRIKQIQKRPSTILSGVSTASLRLFYQINLLRPACLIILTTPLQPQHPPQSMQRCQKQKLQLLLLVTEKLLLLVLVAETLLVHQQEQEKQQEQQQEATTGARSIQQQRKQHMTLP